ncbi:MAG: hypothetical protein U0X74_02005 [Anaerolineales bacterium]
MHLTLGILRKSQAVFYALAFSQSDGFAVPAPAQVTQTVGQTKYITLKTAIGEYIRMTNIIVLIIIISITSSLWILKKSIESEFDVFAIIPENFSEKDIPLDLWETDTSRRASILSDPKSKYSIKFGLEQQLISQLPKKIYVNESAMIVIHPILRAWENDESLLVVDIETRLETKKVDSILNKSDYQTNLLNYALLELTRKKMRKSSTKEHKYLVLELLASGFQIAGNVKQKQELSIPNLTYQWNISTENSGIHEIAIGLSLEDELGKQGTTIGTLTHKIKVVSVGPMTHRQVNIFLTLSGVITTILAILQALRTLGIF